MTCETCHHEPDVHNQSWADSANACGLDGCSCMQYLTTTIPVDFVADVESFAAKFGLVYDGKPRVLPDELANFRQKFLKEELREYTKEMYQASYDLVYRPDLVSQRLEEMLDALVDLCYVAIGTALMHGFDFREAWRRVQAANMAKVRAERLDQTKRGTLYDVVKPPDWQAPDHSDLVADHAHLKSPIAIRGGVP